MWFLSSDSTAGPDSAEVMLTVARNALIADLESVVKFRERRTDGICARCCKTYEEEDVAHDVSWM